MPAGGLWFSRRDVCVMGGGEEGGGRHRNVPTCCSAHPAAPTLPPASTSTWVGDHFVQSQRRWMLQGVGRPAGGLTAVPQNTGVVLLQAAQPCLASMVTGAAGMPLVMEAMAARGSGAGGHFGDIKSTGNLREQGGRAGNGSQAALQAGRSRASGQLQRSPVTPRAAQRRAAPLASARPERRTLCLGGAGSVHQKASHRAASTEAATARSTAQSAQAARRSFQERAGGLAIHCAEGRWGRGCGAKGRRWPSDRARVLELTASWQLWRRCPVLRRLGATR